MAEAYAAKLPAAVGVERTRRAPETSDETPRSRTTLVTCVMPRGCSGYVFVPERDSVPSDELHVDGQRRFGGVRQDEVRPEGAVLAHGQDRALRAVHDQVGRRGGRDALSERPAEAGRRGLGEDGDQGAVRRRVLRGDADGPVIRREAEHRAEDVAVRGGPAGREIEGLLGPGPAVRVVPEELHRVTGADVSRIGHGDVRRVESPAGTGGPGAGREKPVVRVRPRARDRTRRKESPRVVRGVVDGGGIRSEALARRRRGKDEPRAGHVRRHAEGAHDARDLRHAERRQRVPRRGEHDVAGGRRSSLDDRAVVCHEGHVDVDRIFAGIREDEIRPEGGVLADREDRPGRPAHDQVTGHCGRDALPEGPAEARGRRLRERPNRRRRRRHADGPEIGRPRERRSEDVRERRRLAREKRERSLGSAPPVPIVAQELQLDCGVGRSGVRHREVGRVEGTPGPGRAGARRDERLHPSGCGIHDSPVGRLGLEIRVEEEREVGPGDGVRRQPGEVVRDAPEGHGADGALQKPVFDGRDPGTGTPAGTGAPAGRPRTATCCRCRR